MGRELAEDTLCEFYFDGPLEWGLLLQCFHQGGEEKHEDWLSTVLQRWQLTCSYQVITKVKEEFRDSQPGLVITHSVSCNFK